MTVVPGQVVEPGEHRDHPGQVVALLAGGLAAAEHQVVDLGRVQRGHLGQRGAHDLDGQVVGAHVLERALEGAADRRAGGGDDDGFRHQNFLIDTKQVTIVSSILIVSSLNAQTRAVRRRHRHLPAAVPDSEALESRPAFTTRRESSSPR